MSLYDFFVQELQIDNSDPVVFCLFAFLVTYLIIDFSHVFFTAIFSWFKK